GSEPRRHRVSPARCRRFPTRRGPEDPAASPPHHAAGGSVTLEGTVTVTETVAEEKTRAPKRSSGLLFLGKRLGIYAATAVVAVALNFFIPRFIPGDPVVALVRQLEQQTGTRMSAEQVS